MGAGQQGRRGVCVRVCWAAIGICVYARWVPCLFSEMRFSMMTFVSAVLRDAFFYDDLCLRCSQGCVFLWWSLFEFFSGVRFSMMICVCVVLRDVFFHDYLCLWSLRRCVFIWSPWFRNPCLLAWNTPCKFGTHSLFAYKCHRNLELIPLLGFYRMPVCVLIWKAIWSSVCVSLLLQAAFSV